MPLDGVKQEIAIVVRVDGLVAGKRHQPGVPGDGDDLVVDHAPMLEQVLVVALEADLGGPAYAPMTAGPVVMPSVSGAQSRCFITRPVGL